MKHNTLSKTKELVELGTFEMVTTVARISDPCYNKKTWCAGKIDNVLPGTWKAQVLKKVEKYDYLSPEEWAKGKIFTDRRNVLIAVHESFDKTIHTNKVKMKFHGGMDAGMAGIFDDKFYKKNYKEDYLRVGEVEYYHQQDLLSNERDIKTYESQLALCKAKEKDQIRVYKWMLESAKERQANPSILDYSKAEKTRDWYEICCDKAMSNVSAGVIRNGVVSSSGYGDGGYDTFAIYNTDGKVVGIKLKF